MHFMHRWWSFSEGPQRPAVERERESVYCTSSQLPQKRRPTCEPLTCFTMLTPPPVNQRKPSTQQHAAPDLAHNNTLQPRGYIFPQSSPQWFTWFPRSWSSARHAGRTQSWTVTALLFIAATTLNAARRRCTLLMDTKRRITKSDMFSQIPARVVSCSFIPHSSVCISLNKGTMSSMSPSHCKNLNLKKVLRNLFDLNSLQVPRH